MPAPPANLVQQIVLGTAPLGLPYGRRRQSGLLTIETAFAILDAAWEVGIRAFDTAEAYGVAAERLAQWLSRNRRAERASVVTKVPVAGGNLARAASVALERFAGVAGRALLAHGLAEGSAWAIVYEETRRVGAEPGLSVYGEGEVRTALALPGVRRVQAPANVFDDSALAARGASAVPLDIRSVYLQGVLIEDPSTAELRAPGAGQLAWAVQVAAAECGAEPQALLIAAMHRRCRPDDRLVIGVDEPAQIHAFTRAAALPDVTVQAFEQRTRQLSPSFVSPSTLDPRTWAAAQAHNG